MLNQRPKQGNSKTQEINQNALDFRLIPTPNTGIYKPTSRKHINLQTENRQFHTQKTDKFMPENRKSQKQNT